MTTERRILTDSVFQLASRLVVAVRSLVLLPVLAEETGKEGYGVFTQALIAVTFIAPIASLRLETAIVRFVATENARDRLKVLFYSALVCSMGSTLLLTGVLTGLPQLGSRLFFGDGESSGTVVKVGLLITTTVLTLFASNYLRARHRIKLQAIVAILRTILETVAVWLAVAGGGGIDGALLAIVAVDGAFALGLYAMIAAEVGAPCLRTGELRTMLAYSVPLVPNGLLRWSVDFADRIILVQLIGVAAVGVYAANYALGSILTLLAMPIGEALFPFLSKCWDEGKTEEVRRYLSAVIRLFLLLGVPVCAGLSLLGGEILDQLAGSGFDGNPRLIFWVAAGALCNGIFQMNLYPFHLIRRTVIITVILGLGVCINIGSNLFLIPIWGIEGAAAATFISFCLMAASAVITARRFIPYAIDLRSTLKIIGASAVMVAVLYRIPAAGWWIILLKSIAGVLVYFSVLFAFRAFSKKDLQALEALFSPSTETSARTNGRGGGGTGKNHRSCNS